VNSSLRSFPSRLALYIVQFRLGQSPQYITFPVSNNNSNTLETIVLKSW